MTHVATLIAAPGQAIFDTHAQHAADVLKSEGPVWLGPGTAVDLPFTAAAGTDARQVAADLRAAMSEVAIDIVVQEARNRRKRLLLADMDSTMIGQECLDELADFVGAKDRVSAITERAMRGEIAFVPALKERVALLAGLSAATVADVLKTRITLTSGARVLVQTMRRFGAHTCLVSGGFTAFTVPIAAQIGFDEQRANRLVSGADGRFTGVVDEPILGRDEKLAILRELRAKFGLDQSGTLVTGDGANDLLMIGEAGLGVAFHAKPVVADAACARIDHGDLTALLYAQGYRRDEFVTG